jgi:hypothetical protein
MDQFAFPGTLPNGRTSRGMTLRDYFAAKAMQAMVEATVLDLARDQTGDPDLMNKALRNSASLSYMIADAMIEQRHRDFIGA